MVEGDDVLEFKARQIRINGGNSGFVFAIMWLFICAGNIHLYWSKHQFQIELGYGPDKGNLYMVYFYVIAIVLFMVILLIKFRELQKVKKDLKEITINTNDIILPNNKIIKLSDISEVLITGFTIERITIYMKNGKHKKRIYNCYNESLDTIVKEIQNRIDNE